MKWYKIIVSSLDRCSVFLNDTEWRLNIKAIIEIRRPSNCVLGKESAPEISKNSIRNIPNAKWPEILRIAFFPVIFGCSSLISLSTYPKSEPTTVPKKKFSD